MRELPRAGELIGRKYRIERELGAGGMGVVYEAVNIDTDRRVALKWLNPQLSTSDEAIERFKREAKVMGRIDHPNVVAVLDCGDHEGQLYLVMELLRGKSLREWLPQGPMNVEEACRIMLPVIRGVAAAHASGVLHRDLKPENIFLCDSPDGLEPVPKVLDFGIAKLHSDLEETALSAPSTLLGTYQYMAPEQLRRQRDLDERVDVYALGVVLYRMLVGVLPYQADNPVDLALQILQTEAPFVSTVVPTVPVALGEVVARALEPNRDRRFQTTHEFAVALEPFAGGLRYRGTRQQPPAAPELVFENRKPAERPVSPQATPFMPTREQQPAPRRWPWLAGGGAMLAAAGAAIGLSVSQVDPATPLSAPQNASKPEDQEEHPSLPAAPVPPPQESVQVPSSPPAASAPLAAQAEDAGVAESDTGDWAGSAEQVPSATSTVQPPPASASPRGRGKHSRQHGTDEPNASTSAKSRVGKRLTESEF